MTVSVRRLLRSGFYIFASVCSIAGGLVIFFKSSQAQISILLIVISIFLLSILFIAYRLVYRESANRYKKGYSTLASFASYSTPDGNSIRYDLYRMIQVKEPLYTHHEHDFYWTGTVLPIITSEIQTVEDMIKTNDGIYDKILLKLPEAKIYNQSTIIHVGYDIDDSDHASETHVSYRADEPTDIIKWQIELKHKSTSANARLEKKLIKSDISQEYKLIKYIPFDAITRTFSYSMPKPEVGYYYRVIWDR